jgi:hypothetical protein
MKEYKFKAMIKASEIGKGGAYVEFPYNIEYEFGTKCRVPVVAYFEEVEYRGSLVRMGTSCHILGVKKEIQYRLSGVKTNETYKRRLDRIMRELLSA